MTDRSNDGKPIEHNGGDVSALDIVTDLVTEAIIPAPIKRNIFKAFDRLCSSLVDIPAAYLEGIADEKRAATKARVNLIEITSAQIAQQMRIDPEYARVAVKKFGQRVLREQVNLDMISRIAAKELGEGSNSEDQPDVDGTIDDDWLNNFETEARQKSTEDMQFYFGRILAGEIKRPNSFSMKTVKILGNLDQNSARIFRKLCSACMVLDEFGGSPIDTRVSSLGGNAGNNSLAKYGLSFGELNTLNEYGLIIWDYNSWRDYQICVGIRLPAPRTKTIMVGAPFLHRGKHWVLTPTSESARPSQFKIHGVALTRSGEELRRIVDLEPMDEYTQDLMKFFQHNNLQMTEVSTKQSQRLEVSDNDGE